MTEANPPALTAIDVGRAGFEAFPDPALVVVDAQAAFALDPPGTTWGTDALATIAGLAAQFRARSRPVVWLRTGYASDADLGPVWRRKAPALLQLRPGADAWQLDDRAGYQAGELVVDKTRASGFFGTTLADRLRDLGAASLVVAGFTTGGCVRATSVDAASHDFVPLVIADAVADRTAATHEAALVDLAARYADVMPSAAALRKLFPDVIV